MKKIQRGDNNPCPYMSEIKDEEQKGIVIPPKKYNIGIAPTDVEKDELKLPKVESYRFIMKDGEIYRVGENGIQYPPIRREEYEKIAKERAKRKERETRSVIRR